MVGDCSVPIRRIGTLLELSLSSLSQLAATLSNESGLTTLKHTRKTSVWGRKQNMLEHKMDHCFIALRSNVT